MDNHPEKDRIIEHIMQSASESALMTHEEIHLLRTQLESYTLEELIEEVLPGWFDDLYKYSPVPVREWIESKDYMNMKGHLFDVLVDDLEELFEGGYTEAVIDGSIGWGKSYFTATALLRMVYEVSCLTNPQIAYGIAPGTPISFVNAAIKQSTAKEVVFKYCKNFVKRSPYFTEQYPLEKDLEAELVFQDDVRLWAATSSESGVIGQNLFGGALDEINFFGKIVNSTRAGQTGEVYDHAKVLWSNAIRRMQSRFERQGKMPGILLMVSSNMYPDDFTIWRRELAEEKGEKIFHRRYSQWETKPANFYKTERFQVSLGNVNVRPRIIRPVWDERHDKTLDDVEILKSSDIKVLEVPENFKMAFEQDIDMAIREIAGFPTLTAHPFFRDIAPLQRAVDRGVKKGLQHPYSRLTTTLEDGSTWIKSNLDYAKKGYRHFAHVDLAMTGDAAGLTVVRLDGMVERETSTEGVDLHDNIVLRKGSSEWVPKLTQVLSLRIVAPPDRQIQFANVRHVIMDLLNDGFFFSKITYDQWNSGDSIQYFQRIGLESKILSVDKKMEHYEILRNVLQDNLLDMYDFPYLREELARLEIDTLKRKIDHPPKGSKDVADTLAGAVSNAVTFALENPSLIMFGESEEARPSLLLLDGLIDYDEDTSWLYGDWG